MEYQARTRRIIALYVLAGIAYAIFFISMTFVQSLDNQLWIFILGVFLLAMFFIGILAVHENNLVLLGGSSTLFIFLIFFILIDSVGWPLAWDGLLPFYAWIQTALLVGISLYGVGVFIEWRRRRTQYRIMQVTFETQEAFYVEYVKSSQMVYLTFSKNYIKHYQLPYAKLKVPMKQYYMFVHEADWNSVMCFEESLNRQQPLNSKYRVRFPRMRSFSKIQIRGSFDLDNRYFCLAVDITVEEAQNEAIENLHYERSLMLDNMQIGLIEQQMILDSDGHLVDYRYLYMNKAFEQITGWKSRDMLNKTMKEFSPQLSSERLPYYEHFLNATDTIEFETLLQPQNRWFKLIAYPVGNQRFVTLYHDIDDIKRANLTLEYQASHDNLTDLLNQNGLYTAIANLDSVEQAVCYFIDIRDYSLINDYYGIEIADRVLQHLANRLKPYTSSGHIVSRFASDQFVVIIQNAEMPQLVKITHEMQDMLYSVLQLDTTTVHAKSQIGISHYPKDTTDLKNLITLASLAMQASMVSVHNEMLHYAPWMSEQLTRNIRVATKLHHAISNQLIHVHFQHIVDARTGQIIYLESLARWFDADEGWIAPDQFLFVARESHLIDALDEYLIRQAIHQFAKISQLPAYTHVHLAINLAPTTLMRETYALELRRMVEAAHLSPSIIHIEVSEDTFIHNLELCNRAIHAFRSQGFGIAIDDFGSKYSSLSILESVDYDMIKIDGAFVNTLDSRSTQEIIQMVVRIAQLGHKDVVIEKVENNQQSNALIALNCHLQQGFHFHIPESIID